MTVLGQYNFELSDIAFGVDNPITVESFDPGVAEWTTQDVDMDSRASTAFGRDLLRGPTWTFTLSTDAEDAESALESVGSLATAWRAVKTASTPGSILPLVYRLGSRPARRIYGRPRRWASPPTNRILDGYLPITCDFKAADALHYENTESSIVVGLASNSTGGFIFPITFPATTLPSGLRAGQIFSVGDADTYPIIRIDGPITDPWVSHNNWTLDFDLSLSDSQYVEIDTRPWAMTVLRNGDVSVADRLKRRNRLSRIKIVPGAQEITFGGSAASGSAGCTVRWRDAWNSL